MKVWEHKITQDETWLITQSVSESWIENGYWIAWSSFQSMWGPLQDPLYLIRPSFWLGSPNSVLILHPCAHLRASLWFGRSLHSELHSLVLQHKPGHCWLHRIQGHGASHTPFHISSFLYVSSSSLGTVSLSAWVKQGFVVAGDDKGQTSGNALSWGACYPSVSVHRVLSQTRHPIIDCGLEGQLHMGQWHTV